MVPWCREALSAAAEAKNEAPQARQQSQLRTEPALATAAESSAKTAGDRRRVIVSGICLRWNFEVFDEEFATGEVGNSGVVVFPGDDGTGAL